MPDLTLQGTHEFWFRYRDPMIYRVINFMEGVESWTVDGEPSLEAAIKKLGETLDKVGKVDLKREAEFVKLGAYLKASRMLRMMQALDVAHPGAASKLLMYSERNSKKTGDTNGLFLRRNVVFERLRLLARIFAPERCQAVQKALERV